MFIGFLKFSSFDLSFYRDVLSYSAKRGLAIACRSSLRLSVTLVDQLEILETNCTNNNSPASSLFVVQRPSTYSQGKIGTFLGDDVAWGKNGVLEHKSSNISETRKDRGKDTVEGL